MPSYADHSALRSQLEAQSHFFNELSQKTYEAARQVGDMNLKLSQQLIEDGMNLSREMMSCTDPMQMLSAAFKQMQPLSQHLRNYQQQLLGAFSSMQTDMARNAGIASVAEAAGTFHNPS